MDSELHSAFQIGDPVVVVDAVGEDGLPYIGMRGVVTGHLPPIMVDDYEICIVLEDGDDDEDLDFYERELDIDESRL